MSIFRGPRGLRTTLLGVAILAGAVACQDNRGELLTAPRTAPADASATSAQGPTAAVALTTASAVLTQTGTTGWTLAKTGAVDATSKTVTWTITATKGTTTAGQLVVSGLLAVTNTGTAGATIGNIVVLLQQKSGSSWVSKSADVADATHGDAATTANIDPKASSEGLSTIGENSASGSLLFLDAHSNTLFSLQPEQTIAPNATVTLLFSARFDNTVLKLPVGQAVRAEVIVSFGHSTANKPSAQNVDINGNGSIDADEAWVRSVPARLGLTVPAQQSDNGTLTINDVASNITTTGDATFSNPQFNIGPTSGTVTVSYNGGANGGKITNCATGAGSGTTVTVGGFTFPVDGSVGLHACDTQEIGSPTCVEGNAGCGWGSGDLTTYDRIGWDGDPNSTLTNQFLNVYGGTSLIIGGNFFLSFSDGAAALAYLPTVGAAGVLTATMADPTDTGAGVFGGDVLSLQLDIDFSDAGKLTGTTGYKFGDLVLCGMTPSTLNGLSVRQYATVVQALLGGGSSGGFSISDITNLDPITFSLSGAFANGTPSDFAQQHLVHGSCGWKTGDLATYNQTEWGGDASITTAQTLLENNFNTVYLSTFGVLVVGSTFTMTFDNVAAIEDYLPQTGVPGSLTATLNDPVDSGSGGFGGDVVALKLNVDFADAGLVAGTSGLKFGDLKICHSGVAAVDGTSVRQFLAAANVLLGGGTTSLGTVSDLEPIAAKLNSAFLDGTPSSFAQASLVNGACP